VDKRAPAASIDRFCDSFCPIFSSKIVDQHGRAASPEFAGDSGANPTTGARDQRDLFIEIRHRCSLKIGFCHHLASAG
jgi:hypothetical protein